MEPKQTELRFEDKLEALEKLTIQMEEGNLGLEELIRLYEQGILLSDSLKAELDKAQTRLMELKGGVLKAAEEP